ncbi:MAG: hypothetical protein R3B72_43410 [Polyangiaceae bacterium]
MLETPRLSEPRKTLPALLGLLVAVALSIPIASCVNLLSVDGYNAATQALCGQLDVCFSERYYPGCRETTEGRLAAASEAVRADWLAFFADNKCLETCVTSRICLDETPVCDAYEAGCGQAEQCCGFSAGTGSCDGTRCCKPDGIACTTTAECCNSDDNCIDGFCGGFECKLAGLKCQDNFECCTKVCFDGFCDDTTCGPPGSPCERNAQCCSSSCVFGPGGAGFCVDPGCGVIGDRCQNDQDCCSAICVTTDVTTGEGVCSTGECLPPDAACDGSVDCCDGECSVEGFCRQVCSGRDEPCTTNEDCCNETCDTLIGTCACSPANAFCADNQDCCNGQCGPDGRCVEDCQPTACSHSVCDTGPALTETCPCDICAGNANLPNAVNVCVSTICQYPQYAHCCCDDWGLDCVEAVSLICGTACQ